MTYLYVIPFTLPWFIIIGSLLAFSVTFICIGKRVNTLWKNRLLCFLGFYLLFDLIAFEYYFYHHGCFSLKLTLPIAYCSIMQMIASYGAIKQSRLAFEFSLLLGIVGPLQSFMSPVIVKSGEAYLLIDYFISHGLIILVPIYMFKVLAFRPRKYSLIYTIFVMQMVVVAVFFIDIKIGANYMFLVEPPVDNLLISGKFPTHLIYMHLGIYLGAFLIHLPFLLTDLLDKKTTGKIL
jgi:hypothetical integral membrane protein (TIGR02206 family)